MSNKKMYLGATASAVVASAFFAVQDAEASASSYTVQSGDSLWVIAQKHGTTVAKLKQINNLKSDIIFPNQVLKLTSSASSSNAGTTNKKPAPSSNNSTNAGNKGNTYTVKAGDTLSGIAFTNKVSLSNLMKWNNLTSTIIFPGNVFVVSDPKNSGSSSANNTNSGSTTSSSNSSNSGTTSGSKGQVATTSVYVVKSGDTLSHIARDYGVSVSNIKSWNNLKSDMIYIGQKLNINGSKGNGSSNSSASNGSSAGNSASEKPSGDVKYNVDQLIKVANSLKGIPYVWGGSTVNGFDCSGFIYYAYNKAGMSIGRLSSDGYYNRSYIVNKPQVGDLVFFSGTYRAGISHLGIYVGNNEFIHAGTSSGVTVSKLSNSYWSQHFDSFKRLY